MIKTSPLQKGDRIGVIAPSSKFNKDTCQKAVELIESKGFSVSWHEQTDLEEHQFAGSKTEKITALHDLFSDKEIKAIFCLVGGNGVLHLLDDIDYDLIKQSPKIFMGFSDITALLHAIIVKTGIPTFHGPTMTRFQNIKAEDVTQCFDQLMQTSTEIKVEYNGDELEGTLYGGNLSMMQSLIGTPYAPPVDEDKILFIEDINDHLSRYDRMIAHMKLAGWLENTKAILVGQFINSQDNHERPFGLSVIDSIKRHAPHVTIIENLPIGHGERLITLPIGAKAVLKNGTLSFKSS